MWQTPVSMMSPWTSTPRASSSLRAAGTSSTCSAMWKGVGRNSPIPIFSGLITLSVTVPFSNSAKLCSGLYMDRRIPSVCP